MPTAPGMHGSSSFSRLRAAGELRWRQLGLRGNPFSTLPAEEELGALDHLEPQARQVASLVRRPGFSALVIQAPRGWGKSTLLRLWQEELSNRGIAWRQQVLRPGDRLEPLEDVPWLLLDEAQRLSRGDRRRLVRWLRLPGHRLVATTHEQLHSWLPGNVVPWFLRGPTRRGLQQWYAWRLERAGARPGQFLLTEEAARWLLCQWAGNLHDILSQLYRLFQTAPVERLPRLERSLCQADLENRRRARCFVSRAGESTIEA